MVEIHQPPTKFEFSNDNRLVKKEKHIKLIFGKLLSRNINRGYNGKRKQLKMELYLEKIIKRSRDISKTLSEGVPFKQAFADSYINKYVFGPKLQIDKKAEIAKEMAKGEEFAMAERGRRMAPFMAQSKEADEQRQKELKETRRKRREQKLRDEKEQEKRNLEALKLKEWEEKFDREQKAREEQEKLKEERLRMRESNRKSNDADYSNNSEGVSNNSEEVAQQLEALDVENSSKN